MRIYRILILSLLGLNINLFGFAQQSPGISELDEKIISNNSYVGKLYDRNFTINMLDGREITRANLKGKTTLINFWFIGCVTCRDDIPILNQIYQDYKNDTLFQIIGVTFDEKEKLPEFIKKYNIQYPIGISDKEQIYYMNYINGYPTSILIGRNGKIIFIHLGLLLYSKQPIAKKSKFLKNIYHVLKMQLK